MDFSGVLSNHEYLSVTAYLATCSTLAGLGAIFVILRLGASFKQAGKPYLDGCKLINFDPSEERTLVIS